MTRDARGWCPICGALFTTYRRPQEPETVVQPKGRPLITCGRYECQDAAAFRFLKPEMDLIAARQAEERSALARKAEQKQQKALKRLGDMN